MNHRESFDGADLRIALISDMHAYDRLEDKEFKPSFLKVGDPEDGTGTNPVADLKALVKKENLQVHLVLCMGDLCDKARPIGLQYAWQKLQELKDLMHAQTLLATSGNHDCDSRHKYNDHDAKGCLQALQPNYPIFDEQLSDRYWSRNFLVLERPECRIISLNSSAYHGFEPEEIEHGRISASTLDRLRLILDSAPSQLINILICHHPPHPHSELGLGENDLMKSGQILLDLLGSGRYGKWLVVHGHKHHPKMTYAQGVGTAPVVLASGSLSACLYPELGTRVRNQFHVVTINFEECRKFGFVGRIHTWEWAASAGWTDAQRGGGLPSRCGFGYKTDPVQLAKRVASAVKRKRVAWDAIRTQLPELDFIMPEEYEIVRRELKSSHNLGILENGGVPYEIGRL